MTEMSNVNKCFTYISHITVVNKNIFFLNIDVTNALFIHFVIKCFVICYI